MSLGVANDLAHGFKLVPVWAYLDRQRKHTPAGMHKGIVVQARSGVSSNSCQGDTYVMLPPHL